MKERAGGQTITGATSEAAKFGVSSAAVRVAGRVEQLVGVLAGAIARRRSSAPPERPSPEPMRIEDPSIDVEPGGWASGPPR